MKGKRHTDVRLLGASMENKTWKYKADWKPSTSARMGITSLTQQARWMILSLS